MTHDRLQFVGSRLRLLVGAIVIVGSIVLAFTAAMIGVARFFVVLLIVLFLLGISAAWLAGERGLRVLGVGAAPVVVWIVLGFVPMSFEAFVVGFIVLVFVVGISARWWVSSKHGMRVLRHAVLTVGVIVVGLMATIYWFDEIEPRLCAQSERIVTAEQALEFGKQHLRDNEGFWLGLKATKQEIEEILQRERCCVVSKGDYFRNEHSRWAVSIGGYKERGYAFDYEVFFSDCGKQVRVEKLARFL